MRRRASSKPIDVTMLVFENGHASTLIGPMEVFCDAGALWNSFFDEEPEPLFNVRTAAVSTHPVRPHGPLRLMADATLDDVVETDLVFVPSVGLSLDEFLDRNASVIDWLRMQREKGAMIAGTCAGVALLGEAGFLDERRATTHWALVDQYRRRYPKAEWLPHLMVTEQDGVFCAAGVHASMDLALYIVEKFGGHFQAVQAAKSLIVEMPRCCQREFAVMPLGRTHADKAIRRAEDVFQQRYSGDVNLGDLARELGMSRRNFIRRFKEATGESPLNYLQMLRIAAARQMLEEEHTTVQEVASKVGYDDVTFFRNVFKRHTGTPPAQYRQTFAGASRRQDPRS